MKCQMKTGQAIDPYVFNMMGLFENMDRLRFSYRVDLAIDIILYSLFDNFNQLRMTFNMNEYENLQELHGLLVKAERNIPKEPNKEVLMVQKERVLRRNG